jgi:hypothetical protein
MECRAMKKSLNENACRDSEGLFWIVREKPPVIVKMRIPDIYPPDRKKGGYDRVFFKISVQQ